jgi:hypothetical protein
MHRRRWLAAATGFLAFLLLVLNVVVFLNREWESSYYPTSYATLYYPLDVPTIRSWQVVDRDRIRLDLVMSASVNEWRVIGPDGAEQRADGRAPEFRIDTTFSIENPYRLLPIPEQACIPLDVSFRFYSREFYGRLGMQRGDVYIVRSNVACGEFPQFSVADWVDNYEYVGNEGLAAADSILAREVGIRKDDTTFSRIEKLGRFLRRQLKGSGGVPRDEERWMDPWVLYNEMVKGTGKGWCTQNAQVWVFWANRAGIPTRFVFNAQTQDNMIVYTGHAFAESFIREQGRWAFVDLSHGTLYVQDRRGLVLNTAELLHLNQHEAFDSVTARLNVDWEWAGRPGFPATDTVATVPFTLCYAAVRGEFTAHSILKYRRPPNVEDIRNIYTGFLEDRTFLLGNLERYLFKPQLAYALYPTEGAHTYLVRRVLFFLFLASLLLWGVLLVTSRRRAGS